MQSPVVDLFASSSSTLVFTGADVPSAAGATSTVAATALVARGTRFATWLVDRGLEVGDRVAVWAPNGPVYVQTLIACAHAGLTLVNVNTRFTADDARELVERSGATAVITDRPDEFTSANQHELLVVDSKNPPDLGSAPTSPGTGGANSPYLVFTTSGTTSRPKMVLHQQHSIARHAHDAATALGYRDDDRVMLAMPLCGVFGLNSLTAAVAAGSTIFIPPSFDAATYARVLVDEQITITHGSDDMYHRMLELLGDAVDLPDLRLAGYGNFNSSLADVAQRYDSVGATLIGLYGMSEVQALFAARRPSDDAVDRHKAGGVISSADAECRVVDGELQLRGPSLFEGYLAEGGAAVDHNLTSGAFTESWFRTGDLAEADDDQTFTYLTRLGDSMRLGGFLVSPVEIENVLVEVSGIADSQVVAVDRPTGSRPVAFVILDASSAVTESELERLAIEHCAISLPRFKVPVRVIPIDEFPTTSSANGTKIQRHRLREMADPLLP